MSTITSPRASSFASSPTSSRAASPAPVNVRARANRAALRDYYNLKPSAAPRSPSTVSSPTEFDTPPAPDCDIKSSEIDADDFDAEEYVRSVLAKESLAGLLKVESGLIGEIRSLDGEKKALVYDNYSKLITATDTIRVMRENMDPLTPTTSTLSPAMAHIADATSALDRSTKRRGELGSTATGSENEDAKHAQAERETVRWVLATPRRLAKLLEEGQRSEAQKDWDEVRGLLEKWKGVGGVAELKTEVEALMGK